MKNVTELGMPTLRLCSFVFSFIDPVDLAMASLILGLCIPNPPSASGKC